MSTTPQSNPEQTEKRSVLWKIVYGLVMVLLTVVMAVSLLFYMRDQGLLPPPATEPAQSGATQPTDSPILVGETDIRLKEPAGEVVLLGQAASDYLAAESVRDITAFLTPYWATESRSDRGIPAELSYTVYSLPENVVVTGAVFRLYAADGSGRYTDLQPREGSRSVFVYNLQTGTQYRYSAIITLSDGTKVTLPGSIQTKAGPRLMNIDGIVNVRDVGGWTTVDGKTVAQGLLYRGSELDGTVEPGFKITEQGLEQLKSLGIRTDLDLRHDGEDVLGPEVRHNYYSAIQYEHAFTEDGKKAIRLLFADLADPDNYPAYLHCTYGADRTGTMCYLLLGLLGVGDRDLLREYELTALYYGYVGTSDMQGFIDQIATYPGENTAQRVENFLLSVGVTADQIESIRHIFLG